MVLEHLFPEKFLERKLFYSFLISIIYSIIGIVISWLIFGSNSGIVSVFFISLFLLPTMRNLFSFEDSLEEKEKYFSFSHLLKDNKDIIKVYLMFFLGIFLTYLFFSFVLPQLGINTFSLFKEQLYIDHHLKGSALSFSSSTFWDILINNWWVLVACFLLGLITGDGAIFFITWNASVWGTIFGFRAFAAASVANANPWYFLFIILIIVIWHVILEGLAYILVGTAGVVISREIIKTSNDIRDFILYLILGLILVFLINLLLHSIIPFKISILFMSVFSFIILLSFLEGVFEQRSHKMVFKYNFYLFILGILIFIVGAIIESLVLSNVSILNEIYALSMFYS